jgi:hypothetical protein
VFCQQTRVSTCFLRHTPLIIFIVVKPPNHPFFFIPRFFILLLSVSSTYYKPIDQCHPQGLVTDLHACLLAAHLYAYPYHYSSPSLDYYSAILSPLFHSSPILPLLFVLGDPVSPHSLNHFSALLTLCIGFTPILTILSGTPASRKTTAVIQHRKFSKRSPGWHS